MSVSNDILCAWRRPRDVMRTHLAIGQREDRALAYLMAGCFLVFIAQWPRLARMAQGFGAAPGEDPPALDRLFTYELLSWMIVWPLIFYAIAALIHIVAKLFRGRGTFYTARLAVFWSLLAASPAALLYGLVAGFIGPGPAAQVTGTIWLAALAIIGGISIHEAERPQEAL